MNENLKSCPFCGGRPIVRIQEVNERLYTVKCQNNCTDQKDTRKEAIDSWNNRK